MITIRRAEIRDIPTIMQFLDDHWLHGYILAHDREFFDWQFVHDGKVNIWIGIDDEIGKLYAMQCAIFYRNVPNPDMSGSMWIAIKSNNPLLALDIQEVMWTEIQPRDAFSPGLRPDAIKANQLLGYQVVSMDHYYRLSKRDAYHIAIVKAKIFPSVQDFGYRLHPIHRIEEYQAIIPESSLINSAPSKDYSYIKWRYFDHPIFHYDMWKVTDDRDIACAVLITREEYANDSTACKIVDFYGESDVLGKITNALDNMMIEHNYEYMDIYSYGVPVEIYEKAGMLRCTIESENIIPNYFQPYTPVNSDIMLVSPCTQGTRLFRGDSDQDKPRISLNISLS